LITFVNAIPLLISLALSLLILAWCSYQISLYIQWVIVRITGSKDMAMVILFLFLVPGVLLHESAHWFMARLLGLKTSKFRVWPQKKGKNIGLGSVNVRSGGIWLDSLVGVAPLLVGSILIALIGQQVFVVSYLTDELVNSQNFVASLTIFVQSLGKPDGALWAYLLFAIANAMLPSDSDRQPLKSVLLYIALAFAFYLVMGLPITLFENILNWFYGPLQNLSSSLIFVLLLDFIVLTILYIFNRLLAWRH